MSNKIDWFFWSMLILFVLSIGGWVANIVKLVGMDLTPVTGEAAVRIVGIFVAPLGAVMGFI